MILFVDMSKKLSDFFYIKIDHAINCESWPKFEIVEIGGEEGVDLGFGIKEYSLPNVVLGGGTLLSFNVV